MTTSRKGRSVATLVVGALLLTACNGEDDATPETAPQSTIVDTVVTSVDTIVTTSTTTSSTSTLPPTTTQAPTTTIDETATTKAAVGAAVVQSRQDYLYAVQNYDAPDAFDVLARTAVRESPSWRLAVSNMETLQTNGWRSKPHPTIPSTTSVEGEIELLDGPPATQAQVTVCTISSGIVYAPGGAADGSDVIVNDEVVARRSHITMVLQDGAWKLVEGVAAGTWRGATACPAE